MKKLSQYFFFDETLATKQITEKDLYAHIYEHICSLLKGKQFPNAKVQAITFYNMRQYKTWKKFKTWKNQEKDDMCIAYKNGKFTVLFLILVGVSI